MKCKYCGLEAGLFSRAHKVCKEKYQQGIDELLDGLHAYFMGRMSITNILNIINIAKNNHYLSQRNVENCCRKGICRFANTLRLPITKQHIQLVDLFLHNIGIPLTVLNMEGELDRLGKCLYQGVLMSYFVDNEVLSKVEKRAHVVESLLPLTYSAKQIAGLEVLDKAVQMYLDNGLISDSEQIKLDVFTQGFHLPVDNLPAQFEGKSIEKMQQSVILRDLQNGVLPTGQVCVLPVILSRGENVIWSYDQVTMYQEQIIREWVGRHSGFSFRVMKGVYYRTGGSKGHSVERSSMENMGRGTLILTNKNIFFHSSMLSVRIPYKKLIGMTPYSDGIELHQEGTKAKRLVFLGFDSWFMMNVLSLVNG
ncbi:MAG: hypothetical protein ACI3ZD_01325 [Prevotella sp.]